MGKDLLRLQDFGDPSYQFMDSPITPDMPLLAGAVNYFQVVPGLWLHSAEVGDLLNSTCRNLSSPGLRVVIVLDGSVEVSFDGSPLRLAVPSGGAQAQGALIHAQEPHWFERRWQRGKFERKLSFFMTPAWMRAHGMSPEQASPAHRHWLEQPLALHGWQPSARAVALTEQILQWVRMPEKAGLLLVSRAYELIHEAWQAVNTANAEERIALPPRGHARLAQLKQLLHSEEGHHLTLAELGRRVGLSPSALQRQFRQSYGTTIDEYRRDLRLEQARAVLEQTGCSVSEAAWASGYSSAANFSTAFKRKFGISPKLVRARF